MKLQDISPLCTQSQIKALTGKNKMDELLSGINALEITTNSIDQRINRKAFFADPLYYYQDLLKERKN